MADKIKKSPTRRSDRNVDKNRSLSSRGASAKKSRTKQPEPDIYVSAPGRFGFPSYHKASLRNSKGYLILQWREGEKVRSYYLGKARRNSPTVSSPAGRSSSSPAPARSQLLGRIKNRSKNHILNARHCAFCKRKRGAITAYNSNFLNAVGGDGTSYAHPRCYMRAQRLFGPPPAALSGVTKPVPMAD
jgi:hypothetical protein